MPLVGGFNTYILTIVYNKPLFKLRSLVIEDWESFYILWFGGFRGTNYCINEKIVHIGIANKRLIIKI